MLQTACRHILTSDSRRKLQKSIFKGLSKLSFSVLWRGSGKGLQNRMLSIYQAPYCVTRSETLARVSPMIERILRMTQATREGCRQVSPTVYILLRPMDAFRSRASAAGGQGASEIQRLLGAGSAKLAEAVSRSCSLRAVFFQNFQSSLELTRGGTDRCSRSIS